MSVELPPASLENNPMIALGGAFVLAVLIFLLIPMTQGFDDDPEEVEDYREIIVVQPPAPVFLPEPIRLQAEQTPPKPKFEQQVESLSIHQLELSLNPGISDAFSVEMATGGFETEIDTIEGIQKMFTFADLSQAPYIVNRPRIQFPRELIRRGILEGRIVALIEIDERGRATIIDIISSTHPQLVKAARDVIRQAQFTQPTVEGVPQKVRGEWPLVLRAPQ